MCQGRHFIQKPTVTKEAENFKWSHFNPKASMPPILFPSPEFLGKVGVSAIAEIVLHHHHLLQKSSIAHLYPTDEEHFLEGVSKASHFLIEVLGGEKVYTFSYGPPALCRTHAPFSIDDEAREVWLMLYKQTLHDLNFPKELRGEFWNWIEPLSMRMVNRKSATTHLKRWHYADMKAEFGIA